MPSQVPENVEAENVDAENAEAENAEAENAEARPISNRRKSKSVVLMKELTALRDQGKKLDVEFDSDGEPIEKNGAKYTSYIGLTARAKVPIDIPTWKDVEDDLKLKIWDDVLTIFNIPPSKKQQVITIANSTWTNFKSKLTSLYVYRKPVSKRKLPTETDPLKDYPYIKAEVWKRFKEMRMTPEFQTISKAAAERQKKNKYPHRMSRGGYRKVKKKLNQELQENSKSKGLDSEESTEAFTEIKRGDLWVEGRVDKAGRCLNVETQQKIKDLEVVNEEVRNGQFQPSGKFDELTKALGNEEHYGRVRGVGSRVGHKQYFGTVTNRRAQSLMSKECMDKLTQSITEKVKAEIYKDIDKIIEQRTKEGKNDLQIQGKNVSYSVEKKKDAEVVEVNCTSGNARYDANQQAPCTSGNERYDANQQAPDADPFDEIPEKGVECELAVISINKKLDKVALGRVFKAPTQASRSHGQAFGANELRVSVEVVLENKESTPLPLPAEEFFTVGEAIGSFVRWPKDLVSVRLMEEFQPNHGKDEKFTRNIKCRKRTTNASTSPKEVESGKSNTNESVVRSNNNLISILDKKSNSTRYLTKLVGMMEKNQVADVNLSEDILGYHRRMRLVKEDINELLNMKRIGLGCIETWLGFLHSICDIKTYGFLCTQHISQVGYNLDEATNYIVKRMKNEKKQIYIAPYYQGKHWMLVVIDIFKHNEIYWFDSMGNSPPSSLKSFLNIAVRVFGYNGGTRKTSTSPKWVKVNCARQPGEIECGYYIMRYMLAIVTQSTATRPINEVSELIVGPLEGKPNLEMHYASVPVV